MVIKEKDKIKAPIQMEVTKSSIPNNLEIPKPAITVTVQIGHMFKLYVTFSLLQESNQRVATYWNLLVSPFDHVMQKNAP